MRVQELEVLVLIYSASPNTAVIGINGKLPLISKVAGLTSESVAEVQDS